MRILVVHLLMIVYVMLLSNFVWITPVSATGNIASNDTLSHTSITRSL